MHGQASDLGKMRTINLPFNLIIFLYLSTLFITTFALPIQNDSSVCVLNFTSTKSQPTTEWPECNGVEEKIENWDNFPKTLCCRNALTSLSQALSDRVKLGSQNIFLDESEQKNCTIPFLQTCGFQDLVKGTSKCSSVSLSSIKNDDEMYKDALSRCSLFNDGFDKACEKCSTAILNIRDLLLNDLKVKGNEVETEICGVAAVVAVAAGNSNGHSIVDNFYRCLPVLDTNERGYIKLKYSVVKTVLAILIAAMGLILVIILIKYVTKNNKRDRKPTQQSNSDCTVSGLYKFSKTEIENAINFSNEKMFLGRGSAGQVYKGVLPSGQEVAIKKIHQSNTSDSFSREVDGLSRVRHPNLVCLFGCCIEGGEQYLVYEYCSAGNLGQHLLRKDTILTWEQRVKILRDCALGLRYLHRRIDGCIVHRDIKLTNILLTETLDPKLSDFGLAKMLEMEESKVYTDVRGTIGYMDPEYMSDARLTCASDIYSFGIVILQVLSGQKVIELDLDARDQLTRKAKDVSVGKRNLIEFIDPKLNGNVNTVDFESILQIAMLCVAKSSKGRPNIDVVFEEMEKVWKNTAANTKGMREMNPSTTPLSRSLEVIEV